jgi:hypothetical protein
MMKINEYKKLEQTLTNENFNKSYKGINVVMIALSVFGHFASIFLAYFMLSKVFASAMDNEVFIFLSSVIILIGIELLKRDIFDKFSISYLKLKTLSKEVLPLFTLSLILIGISFYSSINGAKEFSSKGEQIDKNSKEYIVQFRDSINNLYINKIYDIENEIKITKSKIEIKDKEQTTIESEQPLNRQQKSRLIDLKEEKTLLRDEIKKLESDIAFTKEESSNIIKEKENEIFSEADSEKKDNNKNSLMFIVISTMIELTILAGVFFNQYYNYRSFIEFRNKIEKDPNLQKWVLYDNMLNIIYKKDSKVNEKLPSNKGIIEICKINDLIVLPKDAIGFVKLLISLNILKASGSARYFAKQRDVSFEILKKQFNVE